MTIKNSRLLAAAECRDTFTLHVSEADMNRRWTSCVGYANLGAWSVEYMKKDVDEVISTVFIFTNEVTAQSFKLEFVPVETKTSRVIIKFNFHLDEKVGDGPLFTPTPKSNGGIRWETYVVNEGDVKPEALYMINDNCFYLYGRTNEPLS